MPRMRACSMLPPDLNEPAEAWPVRSAPEVAPQPAAAFDDMGAMPGPLPGPMSGVRLSSMFVALIVVVPQRVLHLRFPPRYVSSCFGD